MKIKRIIMSRFLNNDEESWVKERRNICKTCPFNTRNIEKITLKVKLLKILSDFYTRVVGKKSIDLGVCSICSCDLYYKTQEEDKRECPKNKWNR